MSYRFPPGASSWPCCRPPACTAPRQSPTDREPPDFLIEGPQAHGVPGLVHLLGIESPGLTSCLAIAQHTLQLLGLGDSQGEQEEAAGSST